MNWQNNATYRSDRIHYTSAGYAVGNTLVLRITGRDDKAEIAAPTLFPIVASLGCSTKSSSMSCCVWLMIM